MAELVIANPAHRRARSCYRAQRSARSARSLRRAAGRPRRCCERFAEHLHAARGVLRVAEVYGAALLAEEMEQVAQYAGRQLAREAPVADGLDALMRAMVQLPTYLERVLGGGRDIPLVLLPLLNDLRAVRGSALLSEGTLLLLNLSSRSAARPAADSPGEDVADGRAAGRALRPRFQLGSARLDPRRERRAATCDAVAHRREAREHARATQPVFQLWWVVGAVLEALREGGLERQRVDQAPARPGRPRDEAPARAGRAALREATAARAAEQPAVLRRARDARTVRASPPCALVPS